ncbi:MAG TPA: AAA family ATPase [Micavibrio sp.]|nr:AAA family ATPase [Micavibrio sp.]
MDRRQTDRRLDGRRDPYDFDIAALVNTLLRRKWLLASLLLIALVPAVLFIMLKPSYYVAQSSVILEDPDLNLTDFKDAIPQQTLNDMTIATQVKVIASSSLAHETLEKLSKEENAPAIARMAAKPETRYQALKSFLKNMIVANEGKSRVVTISYKSEDPYEAARIANAHTEQYVDFQLRSKKDKIARINDWIKDQVADLRESSQMKSQAVQEFRKENGIIPGKNSQELITQQIADLTAQLIPVETQKLNLQSRADNEGATSEVVDSALIVNLKGQLSTAEQELKSLSATYGPAHPSVMAAAQRVKQVRADLGRESGTIRSSVKTELEAVSEQESLIRSRIEALNQEMNNLREKSIALESLEAEETANRTLLENFLTRSEELKSQLNFKSGDVRIVSLAETPTQPVGLPKIILLILAALFASVFALALVLVLEQTDRGIEEAEEVRKILNLRLLGTLPKSRNPLGEIGRTGHSPYLEDLKRIYLSLSQKKGAQSILITAARSGEGKTTAALSLSRYLTSIGVRTILIDANTTSPSIAALAGVSALPGLAEILSGATDIAGTVQKDDNGMSVIAIGNIAGLGIDMLSSAERLRKAIDALKLQYEFIIVDCAPVMNTTDAEIIAGIVDQVVLVVERGKAPKAQLLKVTGTLRQFAKDVPGVIFNKAA